MPLRTTVLAVAGGLLALVIASALSLAVGARSVAPAVVWESLVAYDGSLTDHVVVHARLQRTAAGIAVGAALAVAGAAVWLYGADNRLLAGALVAMGLLVVVKHRANVGRLLRGTEPRIVGKK